MSYVFQVAFALVCLVAFTMADSYHPYKKEKTYDTYKKPDYGYDKKPYSYDQYDEKPYKAYDYRVSYPVSYGYDDKKYDDGYYNKPSYDSYEDHSYQKKPAYHVCGLYLIYLNLPFNPAILINRARLTVILTAHTISAPTAHTDTSPNTIPTRATDLMTSRPTDTTTKSLVTLFSLQFLIIKKIHVLTFFRKYYCKYTYL